MSAGWIACSRNGRQLWFNIRKCGSWRLAFLLARLQQQHWDSQPRQTSVPKSKALPHRAVKSPHLRSKAARASHARRATLKSRKNATSTGRNVKHDVKIWGKSKLCRRMGVGKTVTKQNRVSGNTRQFAPQGSAAGVGQSVGAPTPARVLIRGHYDALGVSRDATYQDIRRAFKQQALVAHPDKGGTSETFQTILTALETLLDVGARADYDMDLDHRGCSDGRTASPSCHAASTSCQTAAEPPLQAQGEARIILEKALLGDEVAVNSLSASVLVELRALLMEDSKMGDDGTMKDGQLSSSKFRGIYRMAGTKAYTSNVSGSDFDIVSQRTYSLSQAIDWHVAFSAFRHTLKSSNSSSSSEPEMHNRSNQLENAFMNMLRCEPLVAPVMRVNHAKGRAYFTADVREFVRHRELMKSAVTSHGHISATLALIKKDVAATKVWRRERSESLIAAVFDELSTRAFALEFHVRFDARRREQEEQSLRRSTVSNELGEALGLSKHDSMGMVSRLREMPRAEYARIRAMLLSSGFNRFAVADTPSARATSGMCTHGQIAIANMTRKEDTALVPR